jgi:hypothetical protein
MRITAHERRMGHKKVAGARVILNFYRPATFFDF